MKKRLVDFPGPVQGRRHERGEHGKRSPSCEDVTSTINDSSVKFVRAISR